MRFAKRLTSFLLAIAILFFGITPDASYAAVAWPTNIDIAAEGGILMDANSGAILYAKNIHTPYYPASITKILTALIIIENCDLNDTLTFSHNAIFNVEGNSSSAGFDVGDKITVKDALYALLLKSANESANALAEYYAGSIDKFVDIMNQRAKELGCTESHFANPSGLNNPNHYVTAYDYALICRAAFNNPKFVEIDSTTYYKLPASRWVPAGQTIYSHHSMLKRNNPLHYEGIIGGKTGFTSLAGNTLVTCAQRNDLKLITVILNGHMTHYTDTKALLDFGFANFKSVKISDAGNAYGNVMQNIELVKTKNGPSNMLTTDKSRTVTLPQDASMADTTTQISYDTNTTDPDNAIARITYFYDDHAIGTDYLLSNAKTNAKYTSAEAAPKAADNDPAQMVAPGSDGNENSEDLPAKSLSPSSKKTMPLKKSLSFRLRIIIAATSAVIVLIFIVIIISRRGRNHRRSRRRRRRR